MNEEYIGKHEKIDPNEIMDSYPGACFHGEVWVRCPHCGGGNQMVGATPIRKKDGYRIYMCKQCKDLFKNR